jgi:hypothetical protein
MKDKMIGCEVDGLLALCKECPCIFSPAGCTVYRNSHNATIVLEGDEDDR